MQQQFQGFAAQTVVLGDLHAINDFPIRCVDLVVVLDALKGFIHLPRIVLQSIKTLLPFAAIFARRTSPGPRQAENLAQVPCLEIDLSRDLIKRRQTRVLR